MSTPSKTRSGPNDDEADALAPRAVADGVGGDETRSERAGVQLPPTYRAAEPPLVAPGCAPLAEAPNLAIEDAAGPPAVGATASSTPSPDRPAPGPSTEGDTDSGRFGESVMEGGASIHRRGGLRRGAEAAGRNPESRDDGRGHIGGRRRGWWWWRRRGGWAMTRSGAGIG